MKKVFEQMDFIKSMRGIEVRFTLIPMGEDIHISIYGGDKPHIGSVVLAEPRPSLTGEGIGVTSSVINRMSHKDEAIARTVAEAVAKEYETTVSCVAGVHMDGATPEDIATVKEIIGTVLSSSFSS